MARRVRSRVATCSTVPSPKRKTTRPASDHWPMAAAPTAASVMSTFMSTWRARRLKKAARATKAPPVTMAAAKSQGAAAGASACATKPATSAPETSVSDGAAVARARSPRPARRRRRRRAAPAALRRRAARPCRSRACGRRVYTSAQAVARVEGDLSVAAPKLTSAPRTPRSLRSAPCSFTAQSAQSMPVTCRMRRSRAVLAGAAGASRSSGPCSCTASGQCSWAVRLGAGAPRVGLELAGGSASSSKLTREQAARDVRLDRLDAVEAPSSRPTSSTQPAHSASRGSSSARSRVCSVSRVRRRGPRRGGSIGPCSTCSRVRSSSRRMCASSGE